MNYRDPVCDSCENGRWCKGEYGTMECAVDGTVVRKRGTVTEEFFKCLGARYKRRKRDGKGGEN